MENQSEQELTGGGRPHWLPSYGESLCGGGGRGIRRVQREEDLLSSIAAVVDEVQKVFGQGGVFLEACITEARHIEVQLLAGVDGKAVAL